MHSIPVSTLPHHSTPLILRRPPAPHGLRLLVLPIVLQAIPYLNRLVIKYVYRPVFSQEYSDEVWAKLAGTDPLGR